MINIFTQSPALFWRWFGLTVLASTLAAGCNTGEVTEESAPTAETDAPDAAVTAAGEAESGAGTLQLVANGEDFVRQGFTTKDGWAIEFDRVLVTLADVQAHQTEPPYDPDTDAELEASETVTLVSAPETVDLAAGEADAAPIAVSESAAPAGQYNASSWSVVTAETGEAAGAAIALSGQASQADRTVDFTIRLAEPLTYTCGEFVGDARQGIVEADASADVEVTFHFDHIFGDAELPADDELNAGALGFEPLAALAEGDELEIDSAALETELAAADYERLQAAIAGLGHVGEGHCKLN